MCFFVFVSFSSSTKIPQPSFFFIGQQGMFFCLSFCLQQVSYDSPLLWSDHFEYPFANFTKSSATKGSDIKSSQVTW
jgi:hypothetical protein